MEEKDDLFKVQINEDGVASIIRLYRIISFCFWAGVITSMVMVYSTLHFFLKYQGIRETPANITTRLFIDVLYVVISAVVYFLQFLFFLRFARRARKAIQFNDSFTFNRSLPLMYRAFWMTATAILVNGIYVAYVLLGDRSF